MKDPWETEEAADPWEAAQPMPPVAGWEPAPDEKPSLPGTLRKLGKSYQRVWNPDLPSQGAHYDLAANVSAALIPGAAAYTGVTKIPALARATGALMRTGKHIAAGAAAGAAGAAVTNTDMGEGAAIGGALGPVGAVVSKIPGAVNSVVRGPTREAARSLGQVFKDRLPEAKKAVQNLRPNIPGERVTTGMAASPRLPEFKALEEITRRRPGANILLEMDAASKAAREAALLKYATPGKPGMAPGIGQPVPPSKVAAVRRAKVGPKYEVAEKDRVPFTPNMKKAVLGAEVKPLNLKGAKAFDQARANAAAKGVPLPGGAAPPKQMISVKQGQAILAQIDDKLANLKNATTRDAANLAETSRLEDARKVLVTGLESGSPRYAAANKQYAKLMVGDRQTKLAGELLDQLRHGDYIGSVRNSGDTLRRAGMGRYQQLEQVASPKQMQTVRGIEKSLSNKRAYDALDAGSGVLPEYKSVFDVAAANTPGVFSQTYTIFRSAMKKMGANSDEAVQEVVDAAMSDPAKMAKLLDMVPPANRQKVLEMIRNATTGGAVGVAGSSGERNAP